MPGFLPTSLASRFVEMGYVLPFSIAELRDQAVLRFKDDMDNAGLNGADIPDDYVATPSLSGNPTSIKTLLSGWTPPGIETWTEVRISNTSNNAWQSQGVTHDSKHWYFTQRNEIFTRTLPLKADGSVDRSKPWGSVDKVSSDGLLGAPEDYKAVTIYDHKYNHYGSPCYFEGNVYLPLEGANKTKSPALLVQYSPDLSSWAIAPLAFYNPLIQKYQMQGQSGWVAINPIDRCIYTSMECHRVSGLGEQDKDDTKHIILVYSLDNVLTLSKADFDSSEADSWSTQLSQLNVPVFRGFFPAASFDHYEDRDWAADYVSADNYRSPHYPLDGISGGVFDAQGRLFLSIGEDITDISSTKGRICCYSGFDGMPLGCRVAGTGCSGWSCEAEGLTVWNGELFLVTLHNAARGADNMNFQVLSPPGFPAWTPH